MFFEEFTGRGVRVAVIDSGVHAAHPHVGGVAGGLAIRADGSTEADFVDRLGHGTAVAAAIHEKAPDAELFAVKIFDRSLATDVPTLVAAIDQAARWGANLINLSLGTIASERTDDLARAVQRARLGGAFLVSAARDDDVVWLPGSLDDVLPVRLDWSCDRGAYRVVSENGRSCIAASGYPRDIPGVPRERNIKGVSFAVANATGFAARALEANRCRTLTDLFTAFESAFSVL
jgi:subtilisin family serine protease